MESKPHTTNELAKKMRFVGPDVLRVSVSGVDLVLVPGTEYDDLPADDYLFSIWKQGYFLEIPVEKKGPKSSKV
jgi:hypothetical protein